MLPPRTHLPQNHEALFSSEIKKYDTLGVDTSRNLEHQDKVLFEIERDAKVSQEGQLTLETKTTCHTIANA